MRSLGRALLQMTGVLVRRGDEGSDARREGHAGTREKTAGCLQAKERGLGRTQACGPLDLRLPAPTSLLPKPPVGAQWWRPELTDTGLKADDAGRDVPSGCAHQGALGVRTRGGHREPEG